MLGAAMLVLCGAVPTGFTESIERIELVATGTEKASLEVDALGGRVLVAHAKLAKKLTSELCPTAQVTKEGLTLRCTSRRLWAELTQDERGLAIDLRALHGLPWTGDITMALHAWPLRVAGIPDECPGKLDAAKGECALALGRTEEAESWFKAARGGADSAIAYLRLGDLALQRGDAETAVHLYAFVAPVGPVGRVARARQCELTGSCLDEVGSKQVADLTGLADAPRAELLLHFWRRELFMNREDRVMPAFVAGLHDDPSLCSGATALCQRMIEVGLRSEDEATRSTALDGWLLAGVQRGPYELELGAEAAKAAESLGAPGFAATVLAGLSSRVPKETLPAHLLRVIELYVAAHDLVRAGVILDYADARLGTKLTSTGGWRAVRARVAASLHSVKRTTPTANSPTVAASNIDELENTVSLAAELARAAAVRSRATGSQP
jgi:hypothetical protein